MRRGLIAGLVAAVSFAALLAPLVIPGPGSEDQGEPEGPLRWQGEVTTTSPAGLPGDTIASGEVENSGIGEIRVEADEVVAVTSEGRELETDTTFLGTYGRGFVETARGYADPEDVPDSELVRTGRLLVLGSRETSPLVVAWRGGEAVGLRYGGGGFLALRD